jgi:DNA-binding CsgD family transcriptional regulator
MGRIWNAVLLRLRRFARRQKTASERPKQAGKNPRSPDQFKNSGASGLAEQFKHNQIHSLTPREYELYELLLAGNTLKECAQLLSIRYSTANTHMTSVYRKLGIRSRAELLINYQEVRRGDPLAAGGDSKAPGADWRTAASGASNTGEGR